MGWVGRHWLSVLFSLYVRSGLASIIISIIFSMDITMTDAGSCKMETLADRMRWLREKWGLSARALSLSLGLNPTAWNIYETNTSLPGASVLTLLASKQVDINWLLTGDGVPFRAHESIQDVINQIESVEKRRLGIGELTMKASHSNIQIRNQICELLGKSDGHQIRFSEILSSLDLPKTDVVLGLMELLKQGRIEIVGREDVESYRLVGDIIDNRPTSDAELAAIVLEGVKFLATDIREGIETTPETAVIWNATIPAENGRLVLTNLKNALFSIGSQAPVGSENVKLVFAAKIGVKRA